jgi:hypothetical protein
MFFECFPMDAPDEDLRVHLARVRPSISPRSGSDRQTAADFLLIIDVKPKHGSPDIAREIALKKIASRVEGTAMASEKLGMA